MSNEYGKLNLLELILKSMKNGETYPYELNYLAGSLAVIINPSEKRAISYTEDQVGSTIMADLKDMYNFIHQGKSWRGINPVIAISNPTNDGIDNLILDSGRDELMKTYPLIGSTLGSIKDPFGSKDELIIIGNYDLEALMPKLRQWLNQSLKINYDLPNGFISRALYDISEVAVSGIAKFNEQYGKYYYVARSVSEGFKVNTNFYYSQNAVPNEIIKREFLFRCVSTDSQYGGAPFDVKAQVIKGEKYPKIININSNKVVGFSKRTWVMNKLFSAQPDATFNRNFSASVKEAQQNGFSIMFSEDDDDRQLNIAKLDNGDIIVEDPENGEITKVTNNPDVPGDMKVEAVQVEKTKTESDTQVPGDDIKGNLDGSQMAPASDEDINQGIVDKNKAGMANEEYKKSTEGNLQFSECPSQVTDKEGGAPGPIDETKKELLTPGGAPAPEEVILHEGVQDKQYSIRTNTFSMNFSGSFRDAMKVASRMGKVRFYSAEEEVPSDNIKENLDGSQMAPANQEDINTGIVDSNKAGMEDDSYKGSTEGTEQFSTDDLDNLVTVANDAQGKVDEIKELIADDKIDEAKAVAEELEDEAEILKDASVIAEEAGHDVAAVKSMSRYFSYVASSVASNRMFSDPDCDDCAEEPVDMEALTEAANSVQAEVNEIKDLIDEGKMDEAKDVAEDVEEHAEILDNAADVAAEQGNDAEAVKKMSRYFSYVASCVLANKTFSEPDEETQEAIDAQAEADKKADEAEEAQKKADEETQEAAEEVKEGDSEEKTKEECNAYSGPSLDNLLMSGAMTKRFNAIPQTPIDPATGQPLVQAPAPAPAAPVAPAAAPAPAAQPGQVAVDPNTGLPIDPATGQPINVAPAVDPTSQQTFSKTFSETKVTVDNSNQLDKFLTCKW